MEKSKHKSKNNKSDKPSNGISTKNKIEKVIENESEKLYEPKKSDECQPTEKSGLNSQNCSEKTSVLFLSSCLRTLKESCKINIELDVVSMILFVAAAATRMYRLDQPRNIV